jgi:sucrose-6-phosphate hydrolase SacC (GH32 family)
MDWGRNSFAARTWGDAPGGRTIQITWLWHTLSGAEGRLPGMPFSQQMGIPCDLSLKTFPDGIRLCRWPVGELVSLRTRSQKSADLFIGSNQTKVLGTIPGGLADVEVELELQDATY